MDQRLAVETEELGLSSVGCESFDICDVVVDAVEDQKVVGARRGDGEGEGRCQVLPARHGIGAEILQKVVGPHRGDDKVVDKCPERGIESSRSIP